MEKKQPNFKFKLEMDKTASAAEDVGTPIIKKQRIMIRPVINLPQSEVTKSLNINEEYDPSQPTAADDEQDQKVDEAYDPFQPTLSDDNEDKPLEKDQSISGFSTFSKADSLKPLEQSAKVDLLNDLDIDQMLDSQYNEAIETKKRPKQFIAITKFKESQTTKQSSKNDFDIFAEEELEKAQAAAVTPVLKSSPLNEGESSAKNKLSIRAKKIKSAFDSGSDSVHVATQSDPEQDVPKLEEDVGELYTSKNVSKGCAALDEADPTIKIQVDKEQKATVSSTLGKQENDNDSTQNISICSGGIESDSNDKVKEQSSNQINLQSDSIIDNTLYKNQDDQPNQNAQESYSPKRKKSLNTIDENSSSIKKHVSQSPEKFFPKNDNKDEVYKPSKRSKSPSTKRSQSPHKSTTKQSKSYSRSKKKKRSRSHDRQRSRSYDRQRSRSHERRRSRSWSRDKRRSRSRSYSKHSSKKTTKSRKNTSRSRSRKRSRSNSYKTRTSSKYKQKDYSRSKRHRSRSGSSKKYEKRHKRSLSKQRTSKSKAQHSHSRTPEKRSKRSRRSRSRSKSHNSTSPHKKSSRKRSHNRSDTEKADLKISKQINEKTKQSQYELNETAVDVKQKVMGLTEQGLETFTVATRNMSTLSDIEDEFQTKKKKKKKKLEREKSYAKEVEQVEKKKKKSKKYDKHSSDGEADVQDDHSKYFGQPSLGMSDKSPNEPNQKKKKELNSEFLSDFSRVEKSSKHLKKHKQIEDDENKNYKSIHEDFPIADNKKNKKKSKKDCSTNLKYKLDDDNNFNDNHADSEEDSINNQKENCKTVPAKIFVTSGELETLNALTSNKIAPLDKTLKVVESSPHLHGSKSAYADIKTDDSSLISKVEAKSPNSSQVYMEYDIFDSAQNKMSSPSLSTPALSPSNLSSDNACSQNSSMLVSSQELTETPSYAETFLEQSRKRWEKSLRNKSPHISSTVTPDDNSASESTKPENKLLLSDNFEHSSLSDISVDVTKKLKIPSGENTTIESSVSAEDIFAESPSRSANLTDSQARQTMVQDAVISVPKSSGSQRSSDTKSKLTDKIDCPSLKDTDFRDLLHDIPAKSKKAESDDTAKKSIAPDEKDTGKNVYNFTDEKAPKSSQQKRSSSRSTSRYSERKKDGRRKRSRSRSRDRRSKRHKSSSRSPRRKRSHESRKTSHDKRRSSENTKSPTHRRVSKDTKSKSERSKIDISLKERNTESPKKELLNMFLEQTTELIPLLAEKKIQDPVQPEEMITSPQPIATISGISSSLFHRGVRPEEVHLDSGELEGHHDIGTNAFKELVNESRPALIQIPTIDSHTSEYDKTKEVTEQTASTLAVTKSKGKLLKYFLTTL